MFFLILRIVIAVYLFFMLITSILNVNILKYKNFILQKRPKYITRPIDLSS